MPSELEKNIYGLPEGVFKACQFLGLKFPSTVPENTAQEYKPSDFFGNNVKMNQETAEKLQAELQCSNKQLTTIYKEFSNYYLSQKCFKQTLTDLNVYFCDYLLFVAGQLGAKTDDYFDFEFYRKSFALRNTFRVDRTCRQTQIICTDFVARDLLLNKSETNKFFANFIHRDWIYAGTCTFGDFRVFVEKHSRFFSKPVAGSQGKGAEIISVTSNTNLEKLFNELKTDNRLLEEVVKQHETLKTFCPDTVNTIRVYTLLDMHNSVHILATTGRFGRIGKFIDNVHEGDGVSVAIDPNTGIITSDGLTRDHDRIKKHPDTGKTFKGFQYPCWEKMRATVAEMAKLIPQLRHIGWDIAISDKEEIVLIEANGNYPALDLQQSPDDLGRKPLYAPLLKELINHKIMQMKILGYKVNNLPDFYLSYNAAAQLRTSSALKFTMAKLIPDCTSLIDLGCRKSKLVKHNTPPHLSKYYPVDFQKHDDEVIACDFNKGDFPDLTADTCLCAFTAEYVEQLPQFLANMCKAAQKQILMLCWPFNAGEICDEYRWRNPFLTDFTEEFLIATIKQNRFRLVGKYPVYNNAAIYVYDFRKIS